jgi:stage II sporulation protein D
MRNRCLFVGLLAMQMAIRPAWSAQSPAESARSLTVELWATRMVRALTVTPLDSGTQAEPLAVEWTPEGLRGSPAKTIKQLSLSGTYRLAASGQKDGGVPRNVSQNNPQSVAAAGKWTIGWRQDGLRVLLTLPSERYVAAALSGEAAPNEPMASLKAMAISMRTFALVNANRHRAEGFGLCDSTHCQALRFGPVRPEVERAVRETAGETLWFRGRRAHVYYTQHCGGSAEAASNVWPTEQAPYLAGAHADPYCLRRSPAAWRTEIPLVELNKIFRGQGWQTPFPIEAVRVVKRSPGGRAELLQITGQGAPAKLSASSFRFAVDRSLGWNQMRSDWYTANVSGRALEIAGRGFGHGVGLCQAGAYEMAAEGHSDTEILSFYFPGAVAGITPTDHGWQKAASAGWTLLTTHPADGLLAEGNAAWDRAQSLFGGTAIAAPLVEELPTTELFRQTTNEPGWMLASTRGNAVFLQPAVVRRNNGGDEALLLHEFLHVLVEQQAGKQAPLWLREGLVEALADEHKHNMIDLSANEVDAALAHPANAAVSRHAHDVASGMATLLCARYGMPAVRGFLRNGLPLDAIRTLPGH